MTNEQERMLLLLAELDELCALAGCAYSLIEHQLYFAVRARGIHGCEADIAMLYSDFLKLKSAIEDSGIENRAIESIENNSRMPGWHYRYVDTSTTLFMLDYYRSRKFHGVGVNIHILRGGDECPSYGKAHPRLLEICERGLLQGVLTDYSDPNVVPEKQRWQRIAVAVARAVVGEKRFSSMLSRLFPDSAADCDDSQTFLVMPRGKTYSVPEGFLSKTIDVELSKVPLKASSSYEAYLEGRYGESWREELPYYEKEGYKVLCSVHVPFDSFMKRVGHIVGDRKFWKRWTDFQSHYYTEVEPARQKQAVWWNDFYFLVDRYGDWKKFMPFKNDITFLFDQGEYDILWLFLEPYRRHIEKHSVKHLPLVFDEDIWRMLMTLYRVNGQGYDADRLQDLHDERPLPPIDGDAAENFLAKMQQSDDVNNAPIRQYLLGRKNER